MREASRIVRALVLFGKYGQRERWREQTRSDILKAGARRLTVESRARAANLLAQSSSTAMFSCSIRLDLLVVAYGRLFRSVLKLIVTRGAEP